MLWLFQGFDFDIGVQIRPVQLSGRYTSYLENLLDGGAFKNRIVVKWDKIFLIVHEIQKPSGSILVTSLGKITSPGWGMS